MKNKIFNWSELIKIVQDTIKETVRQSFLAVLIILFNEMKGTNIEKESYRDKTLKKLKAYPILKNNIREYKKDLEDIYKEEFGTSPAVHIVQGYHCSDMTVDEIRHIEALKIEVKMYRDEKIINEIDRALLEIDSDYYAVVIRYMYFDKMKIEDIAKLLSCDKATIYRNRNRLLDILALKFYGGDVVD